MILTSNLFIIFQKNKTHYDKKDVQPTVFEHCTISR